MLYLCIYFHSISLSDRYPALCRCGGVGGGKLPVAAVLLRRLGRHAPAPG